MSEDISNRTLAVIVALSIIVSVAGILVSMTGTPNTGITGNAVEEGTGTAQFEVESTIWIEVTQSDIDFGKGYVQDGYSECVLIANGTHVINSSEACTSDANESEGGWAFKQTVAPFTVENLGSINVTLRMASQNGTAQNITDVASDFQYMALDDGHCVSGLNYNQSSATDPNVEQWVDFLDNQDQGVCGDLPYLDGSDNISVAIKYAVPAESNPGNYTMNFLFSAMPTS